MPRLGLWGFEEAPFPRGFDELLGEMESSSGGVGMMELVAMYASIVILIVVVIVVLVNHEVSISISLTCSLFIIKLPLDLKHAPVLLNYNSSTLLFLSILLSFIQHRIICIDHISMSSLFFFDVQCHLYFNQKY